VAPAQMIDGLLVCVQNEFWNTAEIFTDLLTNLGIIKVVFNTVNSLLLGRATLFDDHRTRIKLRVGFMIKTLKNKCLWGLDLSNI
jgi:hypothetical protein